VAPTLRTFAFKILPVSVTLLLLLTSFVMLGISTKNPNQSSTINTWLIPINISVLVILTTLIVYNVVKALAHLRSKRAGSRFTLRLMYAFSLLTVLPVLVVSYFSMNFIGDRIDNWFDVKIEGALDDSLELARNSLDVRMRQHLFNLERAGNALSRVDKLDYNSFIDQQSKALGAYEIVLFARNNRVLVYSSEDAGTLLPQFPTEDIIRKLSTRNYLYQLEPVGEDGLFSRVAITVSPSNSRDSLILTALFSFSDKERVLADNVQDTYTQYQEISYQKDLIKRGFRITLLLIMLLSMLFSITRLSNAQKQSAESQLQVQRQHDYMTTVLGSLTSSVITLDHRFAIRRINTAAEKLFDIRLLEFYVLVIDDISEMIQAEHDAAWGEVARRLAHEIKNPLTPIRLSAERLQHRLQPQLDGDSGELLKRMSNTIIHQVDSMKTMVDAFSEYARTPDLRLQNININGLIKEVVELY